MIGVTSFWHGLFIFSVSLVAILCFTAASQGWLLTRLKWFEIIGLLLVTIALFRPDAAVSTISPAFIQITSKSGIKSQSNHVNIVRLHITRNTDYGDRYRLFKFNINTTKASSILEYLGISLIAPSYTGIIGQLAEKSIAKNAGLQIKDKITRIDKSNPSQLSLNWGYFFGLALLTIIVMAQWRRLQQKRILLRKS